MRPASQEEARQSFVEKKKEVETRVEGASRRVGRNLINLFIKRFSCLCWGCRVPTGNTKRLNEYPSARRKRIPSREGIVVGVRAGSGADFLP